MSFPSHMFPYHIDSRSTYRRRNYSTTIFETKTGKVLGEIQSHNPNDLRLEAIWLSLRHQTDVKYLDAAGFWDFIKFEKTESIPDDWLKFWDDEREMNRFIEKRTGTPVPRKEEEVNLISY